MNYQDLIIGISKHIRTSPGKVVKIISSAPYRYRRYEIPKRNGGMRVIHHPSPALKAIQRLVVKEMLSGLPIHDAVYSYREGRNIGMHAAAHLRSNYFTRFDFSDFFPSINGGVIRSLLRYETLRGTLNFDDEVIRSIVRLVCRVGDGQQPLVLSVGAPSSPFISNAVLHRFDAEISAAAERARVIYTRYADDVYVSSESMAELNQFEYVFREAVGRIVPFLRINEDKVQHLSRKNRVSVTGINISSSREISVGRDLKRSIKTRMFLALRGQLPQEQIPWLKGMVAHVESVEPSFVESMKIKFGRDLVQGFLHG